MPRDKRMVEENKKKNQKILMISGGKDSVAIAVRSKELGIVYDRYLFADTGVEFNEMFDYIKKIENYLEIKIEIHKNEKTTWDKWFYGKWTSGKYEGKIRGFPFVVGSGCWAKRELKIKPITKAQGKGNIIYIGIAKDEKHRTLSKEYNNCDNEYKFPLIEWGWSELDCLQYLKSKNLLNPLYKKFKRTGCWCCPKQNKQSLQILFQEYPLKWKKLKQYERDSPQGFHPDYNLTSLEKEFENKKLISNNNLCQTTLLNLLI